MGASKSIWIVAGLALIGGCVERKLTLDSNPPGALVFLNDQEIGRTPLTKDFIWYGNYDVQLRKEGFETIKTSTTVSPPWFQWVPIDLLAELTPFPFKDEKHFSYAMQPASTQPVDTQEILEHAEHMAGKLESSEHTRQPATKPGK